MLEESISCSPGNDKKTSRSRRFYKKTKRKSSRLSSGTPSLTNCNIEEDIEPTLDLLYEPISLGASNDLGKVHLDLFNPFDDVKILAAAELAEPTSTSSKFNQILPQGFVRLEELELPAMDDDDEEPSPLQCVQVPIVQVGPETQFAITESELMRFCEEGEICTEPEPSEVKTPKATNSIVDAILQDFCGSPFSESPPKLIDYDATPIFRFKTKSIRTYSRPRRTRRNIGSEIANVCLPDDEGNMSDSSGLSMQEDMSQTVVPQLDTVDLNNSIRVCENLLNLSSYFTQVSSQERTPPICVEKQVTHFSDIINDIIGMRRNTFRISHRKSTDEFNGFSDGETNSNDTLRNLLEEEDDVLQSINCDSLCYDTDTPKVSSVRLRCDIEDVLKRVDAVINEANKLMSPRIGLNNKVENSSEWNQPYCDTHEEILQSSPRNASLEEDKLFDDIELWTDNDCLLNYKTQKIPKSTDNKRCQSPAISRENRAINEWNSGEVRSPEKSSQVELLIQNVSQFDRRKTSASGFQGFQTASKKTIAISAEAKQKADVMLKNFEQDEENMRTEEANQTPAEELNRSRDANQPSVSCFPGFQTASRKPIAISAEAKLRADVMLKKFEQEEETRVEELTNFQGFQKASMKPVAISAEAKRKADALLRQFEQAESEQMSKRLSDKASEDKKENIRDHNGNSTRDVFKIPSNQMHSSDRGSNAVGFVTASRKPIAISNEAKLKAEEIFRKFDLEEKQTVENIAENDQDWLVNTEFFAEDFEEELKLTPKPVTSDGVSKHKQDSAFEGFKTASKKTIIISEAAKRHADQLMREINKELSQDFRECIEAGVIDVVTDKPSSSVTVTEQVNENPQMMSKTRNDNMHACEALNSVSIVNSLGQSIKQDVNQNELENDEQIPNKSLADRRTGSRSQDYDTTKSPHSLKRKHSADLQQTPIGIPNRRLSCTERTPLNRIDNAILHSCASFPLIKSTPKSSLISRKNLLSLSKRKKFNSPSTATVVNNSPKTPDRAHVSHDSPAPDLKQFFDSVSTSTPRPERNTVGHPSKDSSIDTDFKKINWEDANNSIRACRSDANVNCSMVSPSPKERIERLKMYGEPPPISPISMAKKCRPSGLRRGRSLMKP